jgi:hypothetical protein
VTHAQDGTHNFVFTATDISGKTTTLNRTILVDTTPPTASVTAPIASSWTNLTPATIQGTASDGSGSGVSQIYVLVDTQGNSHASDTTATITGGGAWKLATGTTSWSYPWAMGGSGDGNKTIWIATEDIAGNWSTPVAAVNFGYDTTPPVMTINPLTSYNAGFNVTGTASDATSGVASLQMKIDSGTFGPITVAASWTATVSTATLTALTEGSHTVTVMATDLAGNQTVQTATFLKDTTPPTITYSNISSSGGTVIQTSSPTVSGTMTDVSGVASATYTLQTWNYSTQAWNAYSTGTSLGSPGNATSWNWSLDLSSTGLNLPDGKYQIAITAKDVPGNATASPLSVPFLISRSNPTVTVTNPTLGTFQNGAFPLVGTASDPNGVTGVQAMLGASPVTFGSGATTAYPALPVTVTTGSSGYFSAASVDKMTVGDTVYFYGTPMPVTSTGASLQIGTPYYVVSTPTWHTFTISATKGGAALVISTSIATNLLVADATAYSFAGGFYPNAPVTVTASSSTLTASNGNIQLTNGDVVYFQGTALPAPVVAGSFYYVFNVNTSNNTFQVSATSGSSTPVTFTTTGTYVAVQSPTHPINWLVPAMSLINPGTGSQFSDGALAAYVQVTSGSAKNNQSSQAFTLDTTPPIISVSSPSSGTRFVGNLTITGTTTDPGAIPSGVTGTIQYQIGNNYNLGNASSWTSLNVTGGSYSWTISLGDMSGYANVTYATQCDTNGNPASGTNLWKLPIVFQAVDKAGNVADLTTYYLILDPNGNIPVVTIIQPATGLTFGGQQRITGTALQPVAIYSVEVAVDPSGGSNFPANPVPASISGSTISATAHPFTAGMMVFLSGTTAPQIGGNPVLSTTPYWVTAANLTTNSFQVSATSGGAAVSFSSAGSGVTASVWAPATLTTTGNNVTWYYDVNTTSAYPQGGNTSQKISLQARAWNSPTLGGGKGTLSGLLTTPFVMTFNATFPQLQNVQINGNSYYSGLVTNGTISVTGTVKSSKGISRIDVVESSPLSGSNNIYNTANSYTSGTGQNGSYWTATVTPSAAKTSDTFGSGNTINVMIVATGSNSSLWTGASSTSPGSVFTPPAGTINVSSTGGSFIESDSSGNFNYSVSMSVLSNALYASTTGVYSFYFQMTDMTSPTPQVSTSVVTLDVDNFYPLSALSTPLSSTLVPVSAGSFVAGTSYMILAPGSTSFTSIGAASNNAGQPFIATGAGSGTGTAIQVMTGTNFKFQGSVTDSGTGSGPIQDLSQVVVYLTNAAGTLVYKINNQSSQGTAASQAAGSLTAKDMANGGSVGSVAYPSNPATPSNYFAAISTLATSGTTDGLNYGFTLDGSNRDWWLQIDTTQLSDGPITVNFVAWDQAGNATHYAQSSFVSNYAPTLSNVTLGTDLTGAGSINASQAFSSGLTTTNFTGRNKLLSFTFNSVYGGNNGSLSYSLIYAGHDYLNPSGQAGVTVAGVSTSSETVTLNFATISPSIPDTTVSNGASFTFTVTDATPGSSYSNQSYTQTVDLNIHNNDTVAPTINLASFGTVYGTPIDSSNGGVYTDTGKITGPVSAYSANIGASGGHIEYTSPITSGASAISGQVVFKGKAWDDESLKKITATIPGFNGGAGSGAEFTIATYSGGALVGSSNSTAGEVWSLAVDANSQSLSLADGHVLNWSFTWDCSQIATVAATNVTITFKAYNNGSPSLSSSSPMVVDIVPYVTTVTTALSNAYSSNPSVFNRSAQGYYPISNTGVATLAGYNLYYATSTSLTLNGSGTYIAVSAPSKTSLTATLSSGATSGALGLTVNGVAADNNINNNNASMTTSGATTVYYNQEPNGVNNPLLTDDLYFYVWSFNTVVNGGTTSIRYPSMRVGTDTNQTVGFIYDYGAQAVNEDVGGSNFQIDYSFTQWYDTAIAVDSNGYNYGAAMNGDSGGQGTAAYNQDMNGTVANSAGGGWANFGFYAWNTAGAVGSNSTTTAGAYSSGSKKVMLENANSNTSAAPVYNANRIQQPKIAVGSGGVYMTYYDAANSQLKFRWGTIGGTYPTPTTAGYGMAAGGNLVNHSDATGGTGTGYQVIADGNSNTYTMGLYSAVGVTSTGVAVAAWYDQTNQRLVYSYNATPTVNTSVAATAMVANKTYYILTPGTTVFTNYGASNSLVGTVFKATGAGTGTGTVVEDFWQENATVIDASFAGWYVDLAVDGGNGIHIAYYNSSSGHLKYAYLPTYNTASPQTCTVDSFLSTGTNISIATYYNGTNYVPYISYYMPSFTSTSFSARTAWRTNFTSPVQDGASASTQQYTGNWEVMTLPTASYPQNFRIGIGIKKNSSSNNSPILGYATQNGSAYTLETGQLQ